MSLLAVPGWLIKGIVPYAYLLKASLFFSMVVAGMLLFIVFFLYRYRKRQKTKALLRTLFSDLIAEMTICETDEEKKATLDQFAAQHPVLLRRPFPRRVLTKEMVRTKDSLSGGAAENLRWLYETLGLDKDTLQRLSSKSWHRKASTIQHLAEMQQAKYLIKIYRETNNRNAFIRTEAQIAVVKLTGFKGLRFLNITSHPVSQWQQLSLISQLPEGDVEEAMIKPWLQSENASVVEFALRLTGIHKCYDLHDNVVAILQHDSAVVRLQALQVLKEIQNETTLPMLLNYFPAGAKAEQLLILEMAMEMSPGNNELRFISSLLQHPDEAIRYRALSLIQQISPAWSRMVIRHIENNPSLTYLFPSPPKQVV